MASLNKRFPRYSRLLHLYPASYRIEYEQQILQTLADMLDDPQTNKFEAWGRTALDLPISVLCQQIKVVGGVMAAEMPQYIKQNAIVGALFLMPFFIFIILSGIVGSRLDNTVFWHTDVLFTWLVLLPGLAALLNITGLVRWVSDRRKQADQTTWRMILDWHHNWPALAVTVLGLGIIALAYGHDSVHCVTGNPVRELHDWHQTVQCVEQR